MVENLTWHFILMAVMYIFAGLMHFVKPKAYIKIMPNYFNHKAFLVYASGVAEMFCGIALFYEPLKNYAIYGIVAMLIIFLTVHINMLKGKKEALGIPKIILILRLPLQFLLIWWAIYYL
jgi:uncharacterized membrane protein